MTNTSERWTYLGPAGTFTEQAALDLANRSSNRSPELVPAQSVSAALAEVRAGRADAAIVPLENSVEGAVPLTQDELTHGDALLINAEAFVPITFQLLGKPGMTLSAVKTVGSHPHGLAQVRDWVGRALPQATTVVTGSTAAAAAAVAEGSIDAAAAASVAGTRYGLTVLADDIGLVHDALTRFVLMRRPASAPAPTGNDRTSMVLWVVNEPGTLLGLLSEFSSRGINLTRLESRPTRTTMGEYVFLVDADGHITDPAIADVLAALTRRGALLRYLGSYPRAHGHSVLPADFSSNGNYRRAAAVVEDLERGVLPDASSAAPLLPSETAQPTQTGAAS
ncbi:MAG: prephenate dehydratase [Nakamurella sp.]